MKKVWFVLAMLVCGFASCSDGGGDDLEPTPKPEVVTPTITIDAGILTNGLSFGVDASENTVSFSTNVDWTLSVASTTGGSTWCTASVTSGSKGTVSVKFAVTENTGYDDRSVSVTIKAGTASKTFTITQKGVEALLVTTDKYELEQEGGQIEIEVKANIEYQMEISETAKSWITESSGRALTTHKHTLTIAANEEVEKREGEIYFKSGDKVETVKVYQSGGTILMLTQDEYTVSDAGETITVDIKSNFEYGVQMPDVDWISDEASSRGMSSHTLKYFIAPNETYDSRSAEIIFYDKNSDLKDTLKVIQVQKEAIVISEKNISVDKEGGTVELKVNTNVDFEVQIPSEATWISQTDSRALVEKSVYLNIAENTSEESRSATITIVNKDSQLSESVTINQDGVVKAGYADGVVTIATAGTMKDLLGDDYLNITSLKIVGPINGDDIYYLRKMLGGSNFSEADWGKLTTLDLWEATIVEGGEYYYEAWEGKCYTSDNVIGNYMFYGCAKLKTIYLPQNVTLIDKYAFYNCRSLKYTEIPDKVTSVGDYAFASCVALYGIKIGSSVTAIGTEVFKDCEALASVFISKLTSWFKIEFGGLYSNPLCYGAGLANWNSVPIVDITVPDGITEIKKYAFAKCSNIENVIIPNGVISIGADAFFGCKALKSVTIGNGVTSIGESAFYQCEALKTITIPDNVTSIGQTAFCFCYALTSVVIGNGITSIGNNAFQTCRGLKTVTIGSSVTTIGRSAFSGCEALNECYCYATTPPNLGYTSFNSITSDATLYVPARCGSAYNTSDWGDYFTNIKEMD